MTDFRTNPLRRRLAAGEIGVVALGFNSAEMCDFLGPMGFDAAFVDFEHGAFGWGEIGDISRACDLWEMGTAVRVPHLDEALILRALDLGADSIIVPHVITAEEAERAARACRYPPEGNRGVAGNRRSYGASDYFRRANEEVQCIALVEDAEALANLDALVRVEGVDVFQVAPSDCRGGPGRRRPRQRRERGTVRGGRSPLPHGPLATVGRGRSDGLSGTRPHAGECLRLSTG